jgi:hypothetical protein
LDLAEEVAFFLETISRGLSTLSSCKAFLLDFTLTQKGVKQLRMGQSRIKGMRGAEVEYG